MKGDREYLTNLIDEEKIKILNRNLGLSSTKKWKSLDEKKWCLKCDSQFLGRSVKIYKEGGRRAPYLECGNDGCDGSPIDWADKPWWRKEL